MERPFLNIKPQNQKSLIKSDYIYLKYMCKNRKTKAISKVKQQAKSNKQQTNNWNPYHKQWNIKKTKTLYPHTYNKR